MATGDLIKLGTLYLNGKPLKRPQNPWQEGSDLLSNNITGDIKYSADGIIELKEYTGEYLDDYLIYWREVNIGLNKMLICDRNIINFNIKFNSDLLAKNNLLAKVIVIKGQRYKLRILTIDEWIGIIENKNGHPNLPVPSVWDKEPSGSSEGTKLHGDHNKFWNWFGNASYVICNGNIYAAGEGKVNDEWSTDYRYTGWRPVLELLNEPPIINDTDRNLGDKNEAFSLSYQVGDADNDTLIITERLNGNILRTLNNAPKNESLIINISREQLYALPLNQENKISIEVNDGKGGVSYRNYTFKRTNTAPIISGVDGDLGILTTLSKDYTVTDAENNPVTVVEKIDNIVLRNYSPALGANNTITLSKEVWIQLLNGQHKISIEATDSNGSKSIRAYTFTKAENIIKFELKTPFSTDAKANKILVTPVWDTKNGTPKVEVCNNAFDTNPTWEDCTTQVLINKHFNFTNVTKTAAKWGINIRITIARNQGSTGEISIKGFGGAFE